MNVPIERKLSNDIQIRKARLQDSVLEALYSVVSNTVFHGGTAIWRCYGGNRFSDDLDLYLKSESEATKLRNGLTWALKRYNLDIKHASVIGNFTVMEISEDDSSIKLEVCVTRKKLKPVERNYERVDGTFFSILTLSPEDLICEKMDAYSNRMYVRDLYDICHLSSIVNPDTALRRKVCRFIKDMEKPVDESVLKSIVYAGAIQSLSGMKEEIERRFC